MSVATPGAPGNSLVGEPISEPARRLLARVDRIDRWSLSPAYIVIIGLGFLFTFYDIFDINVSFVQTCVTLVKTCTPPTALGSLATPVVWNIVGYVVGTLFLSPMSDRFGRRKLLLVTMAFMGIGSLYSALSPTYVAFVSSRVITGIGIGADLAIVNTYIGELSPRHGRARFTTVIFINSALGAFFGIWIGLLLTTGKAPWPHGLPFALASSSFTDGWRWMYGIAALVALIAVVLRALLPEPPRWLIQRDRLEEAERLVVKMEARASRRAALAEPDLSVIPATWPAKQKTPYTDIFKNNMYRRRVVLLLAMWFIGYITVYTYASGFTSVLSSLKAGGHPAYTPPEAGLIAAIGSIGFVGEAAIMAWLVEKLERRFWLPIATVVTFIGAIIIALAGSTLGWAFVGAIILFAGFNMWVSPSYALTIEHFPTRARSSGFALVDGVGHAGAGVGILVLAPLLPKMSVLEAMLTASSFLIIASILVQFTRHTRGRVLEDVSP